MKLILIPIFTLFSLHLTTDKHDFHSSITNAHFNSKNQSLEVSIKLFTQDLETALERLHKPDLKIGSHNEYDQTDNYIKQYIEDNFQITTSGQKHPIVYIGKEVEAEVVYLYFEIQKFPEKSKIRVTNTIFFELFDDQNNIVNVDINRISKSAFITKQNPTKTINFNK